MPKILVEFEEDEYWTTGNVNQLLVAVLRDAGISGVYVSEKIDYEEFV